jgi:hypothetical protein
MRRGLIRRWLHRWALLLAHMVRHPWLHLTHRFRFRVIAGPGFLGFCGGAFNPGAVRTDKQDIILLAKGQLQHWLDADPANYMRGSPVVVSLDPSLRMDSVDTISKLARFPSTGDTEIEDFRLFPFAGQIWVNHNLIEVLRTEKKRGYLGSRVCISHFNPATKELTFLGHPQIDFQARPREKNWVFVELRDELYLLYSFHPYRVLKLIDRPNLVFSTVISRVIDIDFQDIGGFAAPVSYSTNPIHYDDDHLLVLIHQSIRGLGGRCYYHWGVLLDKNSLYPKKVTSRPLLSGVGARGALRGVLYVASVVKMGDNFVLFNGEGDSYLTRTTVPKAKFDKLWSSVSDVATTRSLSTEGREPLPTRE